MSKNMKKNKINVEMIAKGAVISALYVVLTLLTYPVSYGEIGIEFRLAEILVLLCFFNSSYTIPLTIGCLIANLFSTLGPIDALFGSVATFLSCYCISKSKNIFIASIFPVVFNAIIVGLELYFILDLPLIFSMIGVAIGEIVVVTIVGCPIFLMLKKRKFFTELIEMNKNKFD